jgi:hypothetical protein
VNSVKIEDDRLLTIFPGNQNDVSASRGMKFHLRPRDLSWPSGFSRKIGRENPDEHRADRGEANETGNGDTGADPSAPTPRRHRSTEEDRQQQEGERCRRPLPEPAIDPLDHPAQRRAVHRAGPTIATRNAEDARASRCPQCSSKIASTAPPRIGQRAAKSPSRTNGSDGMPRGTAR